MESADGHRPEAEGDSAQNAGGPKPAPSLLADPNLDIVFAITLLAVLGVSSVAPVFPTVARELDVAPEATGLLITVFTLPGIVLTPILGILADRYGRKQVLVPTLVLFSLAGSACALARDFQLLLVLRFLQGVGAASLGSLNATLIGDLFHGHRQVQAMGYNSAVLSVGTAVYPSLGGALALLGWYVPFALPMVGLPVALLVLFRLEAVKVETDTGFRSYLGGALEGIRSRKVLGLYLNSLATFIVLYGAYTTFVPLHLAARFDSSAPAIGLIMTVGSLATAVTAMALGPLARRFSQSGLMIIGFALYAVSFLTIPWLTGHWWVALPVALFGMAQGVNYPVVMSMLAALAPTEHRAVFMSGNGMVLRLGQTSGPLLMGGVSATLGMDQVFYSAAAICVAMVLILPWFLSQKQKGPEAGS